MHAAFRQGGREAIDKVMRNQPAVFLKLLVLLVPREHKVEHSNAIKDMTTEQIERSIEIIKEMIAKRDAGQNAKVIEASPSLPTGKKKGRPKGSKTRPPPGLLKLQAAKIFGGVT